MNSKELTEIGHMLGHSGTFGPEVVVAWIGKAVGCSSDAPEAIERSALEWVCEAWGHSPDPGLDTDDLERSLRVRIAGDACEYLQPNWRVTCALLAKGHAANLSLKLKLLAQAASLAAPSRSVIRKIRVQWDGLTKKWIDEDPKAELKPDLERMRERGDQGRECLALGLILGLVDGHNSFEAERLFRELAELLELPHDQILKILDRVNKLFWRYQNESAPVQGEAHKVKPDAQKAARQTLQASGALEALGLETATALIARNFPNEEKKSTWSRVVGALSGVPQFFSKKLKDEHKAVVVRIVYHSILKQHAEVMETLNSSEQAALEQAAVPEPQAPPVAQPPAAVVTTVAEATPAEAVSLAAPESAGSPADAPESGPDGAPEKPPELAKPPSKRSISLE